MKKKIRLTPEQKKLVENHLSIVYWVIRQDISVNESVYGFEYDDLYQEGCLWLCHAAVSYNAGLAKFLCQKGRPKRPPLLLPEDVCRAETFRQAHRS